MKIIPAIDIRGGKVVRLAQGSRDNQTVYSDSPLDTAKKLALPGVEMIHIVDLDGAFEGKPVNLGIILEIAKKIRPKIELGGGIRDEDTLRKALEAGIYRVVIGTKALEQGFIEEAAGKFGDRIVAGIDAREGFIYTKGWTHKTDKKAVDLAREVEKMGIKTVNYTDISQDGMLEGPNIESLKEILDSIDIDVVIAGGISSMDDIKKLQPMEKDGLKGMIIGKAIYENKIDLKEALKLCSQKE